jgi:hypothetical protein
VDAVAGTLDARRAADPSSASSALARRVDYHRDEHLGVTVLWLEVDEQPAAAQEDAVLGLLHRLVAACAAEEIDDDLAELSQDEPWTP